MYADVDDTIVAISSAPGGGARGIVRVSGPEALATVKRVFAPHATSESDRRNMTACRGFRAYPGSISLSEGCDIPAVVQVFRAPRSYTKQDLIEIHVIGSPPVLDMIVGRVLEHGARQAEPGEFTARAYLGGAMTLPEAEAVAATINAQTAAQMRAARKLMRGHLADRVNAWREDLIDLLSLVTADIDFAEEPIDFIQPELIATRIKSLRTEIDTIVAKADAGRRFDAIPRVQLLGPPNAGKSTLINRICGYDRAVASPVSGVTRDLLAAMARIGDRDVEFVDAAGIDDNRDQLIADGRRMALDHARHADAVCIVIDAANPPPVEQLDVLMAATDAPIIIAINKSDLLDADSIGRISRDLADRFAKPVVAVSALTGQSVDSLKKSVANALESAAGDEQDDVLTVNHRQRQALEGARGSLDRCLETVIQASATLDVAELVAFDLTEALDALSQITGAVTTDDLLTRIFSSFCIGK